MKYFIYIVWYLFCQLGSLVDARIWNRKEDDPLWLRKNFDYFWLFGFPIAFLLSQNVGWLSKEVWVAEYGNYALLMFNIHSLLVAAGMSVVWDLIYSKIEKGKWIAALPLWLTIPAFWKKTDDEWSGRIVIGFTENEMLWFDLIRIILLGLTLLF